MRSHIMYVQKKLSKSISIIAKIKHLNQALRIVYNVGYRGQPTICTKC